MKPVSSGGREGLHAVYARGVARQLQAKFKRGSAQVARVDGHAVLEVHRHMALQLGHAVVHLVAHVALVQGHVAARLDVYPAQFGDEDHLVLNTDALLEARELGWVFHHVCADVDLALLVARLRGQLPRAARTAHRRLLAAFTEVALAAPGQELHPHPQASFSWARLSSMTVKRPSMRVFFRFFFLIMEFSEDFLLHAWF